MIVNLLKFIAKAKNVKKLFNIESSSRKSEMILS